MAFAPLNYADPAFDPAYTAAFQLVIIVSETEFGFAVSHAESGRLVFISTGNSLSTLFDPQSFNGLLVAVYQRRFIALTSDSFCLVPDKIYQAENRADFASFMVIKEAYAVLSSPAKASANTVLFTFPKEILKKLESRFNANNFCFVAESWFNIVAKTDAAGQFLHVYMEAEKLRILKADESEITFYNQFVFTSTDELIYYISLITNKLNMEPNQTKLIIYGFAEPGSEPILRLQDFFKEITFFKNNLESENGGLKGFQTIDFSGFS